MDNTEIQFILKKLGERVAPASSLVLVGGAALALLGSPRMTVDIDFVGDDVHPNELHRTIMQIARELKIHVEPVPIERFIPLPKGSDQRSIRIGQFGKLEIFVADPYSIALSKLDRGFDISLDQRERITRDAQSHAGKYDLHPEMLAHLQELKHRLS